ncbi:MAG: gamma-glutamyl-gamma-aminobutyrate hydrolase family protein [Deltaproteobacteria bacterium]|nr:gamma-glutamyl-gamma-aminobutyrate hydrolase family protein [Deltaproteobacteria bacterium]
MVGLRLNRGMRRVLFVLLACVAVVAVVGILHKLTERHRLDGVLIDLELIDPDRERCRELRDAIVRKVPSEVLALKNIDISLEYLHFSQVEESLLNLQSMDFVVLSPQGTPWHMYRGQAGLKLDAAKAVVRDLAVKERKPVLGICGGHQFLALAFGGTVDFIDPKWSGRFPEKYPKDAISEQGLVQLETVMDDPIFKGISAHPGRFLVMQSHYEEVKVLPEPFVNLATSSMSSTQLMRIPGLPVYGTAFHPERGWDAPNRDQPEPAAGKQMLANFLEMAFDHKHSSRAKR